MASTWMVLSWVLLVHVVVVAWGLLRRSRRQLIASLRERAVAAEVEARLRTEHARLEAREALAREMHDVLGHRLSLLTINAGALAYHRTATAEETRAGRGVDPGKRPPRAQGPARGHLGAARPGR